MSATCSHARALADQRRPEAARALELADTFCRQARRRVRAHFQDLWRNDDARLNRTAAETMRGEYAWLAEGRMDIGLTSESFKTRFMSAPPSEEPEKVAAAS